MGSSLLPGVLGIIASVGCLAMVWSLVDERRARRLRSRLDDVVALSPIHQALLELDDARFEFQQAVRRHRRAERQYRDDLDPATRRRVDGHAVLVDEARDRLFAADRRVATIVGSGRRSTPGRWIGYGLVRSWGCGVVGAERAFIRIEALDDPAWWVLVEVHRPRGGIGLGWSSRRLGLVADEVGPEALLALLGAAFDDTSFELHPGIDLGRWWRDRRATWPDGEATRLLVRRGTVIDLIAGLSARERGRVGRLLVASRPGPDGRGVLASHVGGPSLGVGVWGGRRPVSLRLLATSGQPAWFAGSPPLATDLALLPDERPTPRPPADPRPVAATAQQPADPRSSKRESASGRLTKSQS